MSNFRILSKEPDCDLFLMRPVNWFLKTDALKIPNLIHSSTAEYISVHYFTRCHNTAAVERISRIEFSHFRYVS